MDKSLVGHAIVATALAILAYVAWVSPKEATVDTVTMLGGKAAALTEVRWQEERWDVRAVRQGDRFDVTVQKREPPPKVPDAAATKPDEAEAPDDEAEKPDEAKAPAAPDATPPPAVEPAVAPAPAEPPRTYPGTDKVKELFDSLAPLEAARALGKLGGDKLAALGLKKPSATLTLRSDTEEQVVQIGDAAYGSGDLYVLAPNGEVYLLASTTLSTIRYGATALLDKEAVGVARERVSRVTVAAGAQGRELVQRHAAEADKRFVADPAEPDTKLELASNWLDRFWRLRVIDLSDATPAGDPALEIELFGEQESLGVVKLWPPDERVALATSTRFRQPFTVAKASAETLLKDLESLLKEGR